MRNTLRHIWHLPRNAIVAVIRGYQSTLSPDHGPLRHLFTYGYCRHSPTCSEYAVDVVSRHGAIVGSAMAFMRVLTCNPWRKPNEKKVLETIERHFPN